ncbi:MAG: HAMP domain-containing histidine kinase [Thaumarchaeota archaeon]|nr:HAMP domain-containing histidine kinase [Nitrososphaerota archaeon]
MSKKHVNASKKISVIIAIQIAIILSSFLSLQVLESEKIFLGNAVNVSGRDRFLTANILVKLQNYNIGGESQEGLILELKNYENNLMFLKNGGSESGLKIDSLDTKFYPHWEAIYDSFVKYNEKITEFIRSESNIDAKSKLLEISQIAQKLVEQNDALTLDLGLEVEKMSSNLILLQILLAIVNIGVHLFMMWLILRILKEDTERLTKMERLYTIGEMAARLAHDLRNPLGVIKMTSEILLAKSDGIDEKTKERYKMIEMSARRMNHQIDDVMDFVRTKEPQLRENSIREIITSAAKTTEIPPNIQLTLPENDVSLRCDQKQVVVLLSNLISNAVQAIGEKNGTVTVRLGSDLHDVIIEIEDSGPGIKDDEMPKIFEPLFTTKPYGTGLGLVSCKNIVDAHKGKITVQNNPTKFIIKIPKIIDQA